MSKKSVVSLFLMADVEGAFDNVNPVRAKEAMIRRGGYYHLGSLMAHMLEEKC